MVRAPLLAITGLAAAAIAAPAAAAGFYLQEQSARGTGRAYAGEVADQGPSSLWWNPAAIAGQPREAYLGAAAIFVEGTVSDDGSTITYPGGLTLPIGGEPRAFNPITAGLTPSGGAAMPIAGRFAIGVSVAAPFNFTTKYQPRAWTRFDALTSRLTTADIQLTGAWRVNDWLDLGIGADAQYASARLVTASPNLSPLLPDGQTQLTGDGWDWGFTAGFEAHYDAFSFGASYRSAIDHRLDGRVTVSGLLGPLAGANADVAGTASFTTPWIATFGARWRVNDKLTLDGQGQYFGWGEFDAINVETAGGGHQRLSQNYKDTVSGGIGADYALNERLTLRAGVQFDPTPTPDNERTARVPDGDRWLFGVGATARAFGATYVDASFAYINFSDSRVRHDNAFYAGTPAQTVTRLDGDVTAQGYVLAFGVRSRF